MGMMNGMVRETEREMGNVGGVALPSQLEIVRGTEREMGNIGGVALPSQLESTPQL
jgi:hypothetical protein